MKALFLDRDGIINVDHGYVSTIEAFAFNEDIFDLLRLFVKYGYALFIVTNQSGIGRGYYTIEDFNTLTAWMVKRLEAEGIPIVSVHHCPHLPDEGCDCRKPALGMANAVLRHHAIDLSQSWMIGDKQSDIDFAHNAGIAHTVAINTHPITRCEYQFATIGEAKAFFEENWDKIAL